jgi:hypothetical protein
MGFKSFMRKRRQGTIVTNHATDTTGVYEYPDALLTMYINTMENGGSPHALRRGIDEILKRIQSPRVRYILQDIKRASLPDSRLNYYYGCLERDMDKIDDILKKENPQ